MKRILCLFLILTIAMSYGCGRKGTDRIAIMPISEGKQNFELPEMEFDCKPVLKPYSARHDLSNVSNIKDTDGLDLIDRYLLSKNLFLIKKPDTIFEQPFNVYEQNSQEGVPSFITSDSVLHIYHLMCDYIIRNIERERLINELKVFTRASFAKAMEIYRGTREASARKAAVKNVAYFGIAMKLLDFDLPGGIPLEANRIIDNDVKRVKSRWGNGTSEIFPYYIDYKRYIARGHYSRETDFRNYFLAMMWYGNTPLLFEMFDSKTGTYQRQDEQIAMAVIMTSSILADENLRKTWDDIYKVSTIYWGKGEDITLYDLSCIISEVYGEKIDFDKIWNEDKIKKVYELSKERYNQHSADTIAGKIDNSNKDNRIQAQFRLMGQIYNLNTHIYNNLLFAKDHLEQGNRELKGLDIPTVFGSNRAYEILNSQSGQDKAWQGYSDNIERLRSILSGSQGDNAREYSLNNSLLWILKGYLKPAGAGYPSFMVNDNWDNKKLLTYAGSVSDAKHPTYMTAKSGEVKEPEAKQTNKTEMPGYVEPDIELYSRLEYMGRYIKRFLTENDFINSSLYNAVDSFIDSTAFIKNISKKELENLPLTKEEESRLINYAYELKILTMNVVEGKDSVKQWEMIPKVDRNMGAITDAYLYESQVFQTAVGTPDYIYVLVPYKDKLYLTRGSIYTYYEFVQPLSRKYSDGEWQDILKNNKEPVQEEWIENMRSK